jgi:hypothetical protein
MFDRRHDLEMLKAQVPGMGSPISGTDGAYAILTQDSRTCTGASLVNDLFVPPYRSLHRSSSGRRSLRPGCSPARQEPSFHRTILEDHVSSHFVRMPETGMPPLEKGSYTVRKQLNFPVQMRDGAVLLTDIYWPPGGGGFPVLLHRTWYDKTWAQGFVYAMPEDYARHGYIVVVQDVRGQFMSEGEF